MSLRTPTKKRSSLSNIVDKLSRDVAAQKVLEVASKEHPQVEVVAVSEPDSAPVLSNPCSIPGDVLVSAPASPSVSEDSSPDEQCGNSEELINKEEKESRKGKGPSTGGDATVQRKRRSVGSLLSKRSGCVPKAPMRCDVCGLRVYKSYRYISRTSAPLHLKSFVTPNADRFRVCKRCFSSRERCRQNLALILLRSKTSQMTHLRTPLGVTYNRATKGVEYLARDLRDRLKRPYDDLTCDETLLDEDEMSNEDLSDKEDEKPGEPAQKIIVTENGNFQPEITTETPASLKNIGLVTVVRPHNGFFNVTPNCFTLYGEVDDMKMDDVVLEGNKPVQVPSPEVKTSEKPQTPQDKKAMNGGLSIEINSINNKLTLLDHAYALPPPKSKPQPKITVPVTKPAKSNDAKPTKNSPVKPAQPVKKETADGQTALGRTCGIVCFLCDKLVTKSYSCYNKDTAPEKVKHLFTDGAKVVKVCRRCIPYRKPKVEDESKVKKKPGKPVKDKLAKIKKCIKPKPSKTSSEKFVVSPVTGKGKLGKNESSPQGAKSKSCKEDGKKGKGSEKLGDGKGTQTGSQANKSTASKVSSKDVKVEKDSPEGKLANKATEETIQTRPTGKETLEMAGIKPQNQKSDTAKGSGESQAQIVEKAKVKEKPVSVQEQQSQGKKANAHVTGSGGKEVQGAKAESGTQSTCSLIGVKMKSKAPSTVKDVKSTAGEKVNSVDLKSSVNAKEAKEDLKKNDSVSETKGDALSCDTDDVAFEINDDSTKNKTDSTETTKSKTVTVEETEKKEEQNKEKREVEKEIKEKNNKGRKEEIREEKEEDEKEEKKEKEEQEQEEQEETEKRKEESKDKTTESRAADTKTEASKSAESMKEEVSADKYKEIDTTKKDESPPKPTECKPKETEENKVSEVSSPRRSRNVPTPERKKDSEKPVTSTVITRKRLASMSEAEVEASKQTDEPVAKRRALAVLRERMLKKVAETESTLSVASEKQVPAGKDAQSHSEGSMSEADGRESSQKPSPVKDLKKEGGPGLQDDSHSNKYRVQGPIKCASCKHRVVKSYRCIQRDGSPLHIIPLFSKEDADEMLRICRRCLKPGQAKSKA